MFPYCRAVLPDQGNHVSAAASRLIVPRPACASDRPRTGRHAEIGCRHTFLMVGLPGAGKTTRAKEIAATHQALRFTPDHWMIPLFGDSMAEGKRWVLEGRLLSLALQALGLGISVVLDYGL